jgi:hypothetical protein
VKSLIIDTRNFLPGKKVSIKPEQISGFSWSESQLYVELTVEEIKSFPEVED